MLCGEGEEVLAGDWYCARFLLDGEEWLFTEEVDVCELEVG